MDVRLVYGKKELHPEEINWLKDLAFIRRRFCNNLYAKCHLSSRWVCLLRMRAHHG